MNQNLTFPVQPDPVSGMHCWHQKVTVTPAEADDQYGDVVVDTEKSRQHYADWLKMAKPATGNLRRPLWLAPPPSPSHTAPQPRSGCALCATAALPPTARTRARAGPSCARRLHRARSRRRRRTAKPCYRQASPSRPAGS